MFRVRDFGRFGRVHSSVFVDKPGNSRGRSLVFQDLGVGSAHLWPNMLEVWTFWRGSKFGFGGRTWAQESSKFDLSSSKQF